MMTTRAFFAACLLALCCAATAGAQTPTPTPNVIRIGTPPGGTSSNSAPGQRPPGGGQPNTLVCRMGGEMRWSLVSQFGVEQVQLGGKTVRVPVVVSLFDQLYFAKSAAPAGPDGSNLSPGQCGWRDRPMTASDPQIVIAEANDFMLQQNVLWGNGSTLRSEATVFGGALSFQNKQAFSMQVAPLNDKQLKVVAGTKPAALK